MARRHGSEIHFTQMAVWLEISIGSGIAEPSHEKVRSAMLLRPSGRRGATHPENGGIANHMLAALPLGPARWREGVRALAAICALFRPFLTHYPRGEVCRPSGAGGGCCIQGPHLA